MRIDNLPAVVQQLRAHQSVRDYTDQPVTDEMVGAIVEAAQWASSSSFRQSYSVIAVRDPERKKRLRELCSKQRWVEEAPVFLAFCVDMNRLELACQMHDLHANLEHTETFLIAALYVGILLQNAAVAAEAFGLGLVMIGGLRNQPRQVAELLELPQGVVGICGMCLGWPAKFPKRRPRLPLSDVLHWETYDNDQEARRQRLEAYDAEIKQEGIYPGKDGAPARGWSEAMSNAVSKGPLIPERQILRQILIERGFGMK
jgi:FMN reductase (NADPH)